MRGSIRQGSSIYPGHDSMRSYASSNAIPIGIPDYYLEQHDSMPSLPGAERPLSEDDYGMDESPVDRRPPTGEDDRDSRLDDREDAYSSGDEASPEPAALIRQASLGRKSKPTLTTVKSGERMRKLSGGDGLGSLPSQQRPAPDVPALDKETGFAKETGGSIGSDSGKESYEEPRDAVHFGNSDKGLEAGGAAAVAALAIAAPIYAVTNKSKDNASQRARSSDILSSGTGLIDPSSSESEKSLRNIKQNPSKGLLGIGGARSKPQEQTSRERSPLAQEVDPRMTEILAGLQKGGALSSSENEKLKTPKGGLSERAGKRRPPRLNVDAVRDAEARGSLTSLPDLIMRATRLASNLDRGKTASRLGTHWVDGAAGDEKHQSGSSGSDKRRSGTISDMLASFPPPGLATPPSSRGGLQGENGTGRGLTNWSSNLRHSYLPSDSDAGEHARRQRRSKRYCGMPLWMFLLLLILLILLIAAAIIVPVVLVVIPRQQHQNSNNSSANPCASNTSCLNGGASVAAPDGTCHCICVNGYTGATCATASSASCTTTSVGSTTDATLGDALPRLLRGAQSNFSVPLDAQTLLGLFSSQNLSCHSENALVTFGNSAGSRRGLGDDEAVMEVEAMEPTATLQKRQTATGSDGAATSNGIVYETGAPSSSTTPAASASATPSSSSSSSTTSTNSTTNSTTTQDFARIAVLYVLQTSGQLTTAATAQEQLQSYFSSGRTTEGQEVNPSNVTLGGGFSCDLGGWRIGVGNGTVVGGGGGGGGG